MSNPLILKNVSKNIRNKQIIKNISFELQSGEVFGFIGPNGAGKTTTIRMIVGLMELSEGDIIIQGKSIKTDYKNAVREVGAIVENPEMYPFLTGWQNLKHFANMLPDITEERIHEVTKLVGLERVLNEKAGRYSLGMRQRLGIAQALLHKPSILILDEPTNGLDPAGIREMRDHIRNLAKNEGVTVIVSSHLLSEIELMCDRIGIIKNGELIAMESVHEHIETTSNQLREIHLEATPIEKVRTLLNNQFGIHLENENGLSTFQCEKESIPTIVKTLVQNDIALYQVSTKRVTLEDKFLELVGDNEIV